MMKPERLREGASPIALGWSDALQAQIDPFGATLLSLRAPLRNAYVDLILPAAPTRSFDPSYAGRLIGRYANRIENARFAINGRAYSLAANDGPNHLHGGVDGLHSRLWRVLDVETLSARRVTLECRSPDGEGGYPGNLDVIATYDLLPDSLRISVDATTDRLTPVSFTAHSYFNLTGDSGSTIEDHVLSLAADQMLPIDGAGIPEGPPRSVAGTVFDFRRCARLGDRMREADPQIQRARGFDHAFVLNGVQPCARLISPCGRITMELFTNQPALHFYTGQSLSAPWRPCQGLCLEPEQFPNAPNRPDFPPVFLARGGTFHFECVYSFQAR